MSLIRNQSSFLTDIFKFYSWGTNINKQNQPEEKG